MSFNVLADVYAEDTKWITKYCKLEYLSWQYRSPRIIKEISQYSPDIACLQEVDHYEFYQEKMKFLGYEGHYKKKSGTRKDGCAIFYKTSKFRMLMKKEIEYEDKKLGLYNYSPQNALFLKLEVTSSNSLISVIVTHLKADSEGLFETTRIAQTIMLLNEVEKFCEKDEPIIICGDFNTTPDSKTYQLLASSKVENVDIGHSSGKIHQKYSVQFKLNLMSAYSLYQKEGGEPPHSIFSPGWEKVFDYIWFTPQTLQTIELLDIPNGEHIPNKDYPSDHFLIVCRFAIKKK